MDCIAFCHAFSHLFSWKGLLVAVWPMMEMRLFCREDGFQRADKRCKKGAHVSCSCMVGKMAILGLFLVERRIQQEITLLVLFRDDTLFPVG